MEIIKTGQDGVMISLNSDDYDMIVSPEGKIDAVMARTIAMRAMDYAKIDYSDMDFSLDAFFGHDNCLLFAAKKPKSASVVYKFRSLRDVCSCASVIPSDVCAALYFYNKSFFLEFTQLDHSLLSILSEYGKEVDSNLLSSVKNNGKLLCNENTIETLRKI